MRVGRLVTLSTGSRINLSHPSGTAAKSVISPLPAIEEALDAQISRPVHFSRHYVGLIGIQED
jgi:hypothetical protein